MVNVIFITADGKEFSVVAAAGETAREAALFNDVPGIDGDCGGVCACATCHVHVDAAWIGKVGRLEDGTMESDLIQFAEGVDENSRLACQIPLEPRLDGLVLHVPKEQH